MDIVLVMFKNDGRRKDFAVTNSTTVIGRAEDCELRVPLLSVSRRHCQLSVGDQGLTAKDLGSSNGTYVNNKRISEETVLQAGDRLAIGPVVFTVQIDGKPEEIRPVKTKAAKKEAAEKEEAAAAAVAAAPAAAPAEAPQVEKPADEEVLLEAIADDGGEGDVDPISALEALAEQSEKEAEKKRPSS